MVKKATLGAGCFWCIEACFKDIEGIITVTPGYAGGFTEGPTYESVCEGITGHAEVARIVYDDELISFEEIMEVFWFVHDPTQLNRQGDDIGTQYRSVVFFHDEIQQGIAEKLKNKLEQEKVWDNPIVTEICALTNYFEAEEYHKDYFNKNPENQYCNFVVRPKVEKFKKIFTKKLKEN
ncbi:MAG: peptide-methionine (S)-S-oxide reductase MsrA [Flavobacteriia bacterium]|nr:peptide-methionine (S)-S-oxide reductase MsrA [Flavobacteriia bacterium]